MSASVDSTQNGFASLSPGTTLEAYANEVVGQLPAREGQAFDFVLVHPQQSQASGEIWGAFEEFVSACRG